MSSSGRDKFKTGIGEREIINRFTNVLYDFTRREVAEKIGHGPGARWKIVLRDSEVL